MINGAMLFVVAGYILWEAIGRFRQPQEIASTGMLVIAAVGLVINMISMRLLQAGSGESLNVKGAYLEVWADMLGSVAVIAGALLIQWTGWKPIDPILAVLIGLWVLPRTYVLMREAINVLLEGVPKGMDVARVRDRLSDHDAVLDVHDLHVWALASSTPALTAHIVMREGDDADRLRRELGDRLHDDFGIEHVTLQIEADHCGEACGQPSAGKDDDHAGHDHAAADAQGHRGHVHR
jgi:cobalt-zinc-cadmium efflux system protein